MANKKQDRKEDTYQGEPCYVYPSGLIRSKVTGQILKPAPNTMITPETAPAMLARQREVNRERVRLAIDESAIRAGRLPEAMKGSGAGFAELVGHACDVFLESNNVRGLSELLGKLATVLQLNPEKNPTIKLDASELIANFIKREIESNNREEIINYAEEEDEED